MVRIGLLSDTHGFLDPGLFNYFKSCDEIWHAGDFGSLEVSQQLSSFKPLRGVYGNIDGTALRKIHPKILLFTIEEVDVCMTHIGGYPGKYAPDALKMIETTPVQLFICGHSHILKVMRDPKRVNMLHINPGAAGKEGFHKVRTAVRFTIEGKHIRDLDLVELENR